MPLFHAIAAMSENRVIGNQGKIPWHLPEDFRWFKQKTMGGTLVMGRKTFESIGKPLPGRRTIVLSRTGAVFPNVETVKNFDELLTMDIPGVVYIAGGAEIYRQALPFCQELFLTVVKRTCAGDTYFPAFEHLFPHHQVIQETNDFLILRYYKA